jgi:hypothetical protein
MKRRNTDMSLGSSKLALSAENAFRYNAFMEMTMNIRHHHCSS